jgi:pyrroline-5-carboxylate reductase
MSTLEDHGVVLYGCGKMGEAIARGAVGSGALAPERLSLVDRQVKRVTRIADALGATFGWRDPGEETPRLVVVAVKPQHVEDALRAHAWRDQDVIVSVAAGVSIGSLRRWAPGAGGFVRAMPNTPSLVGEGVTGIMADAGTDLDAARALFAAIGEVVELTDEAMFDPLTAISGSGPAYFFTAIEALADGGVLMGLPRDVAITLAAQTLRGAAALALSGEAHTAELKDRVASPAGTTIAALRELERAGFRNTLISAVEAAATRSRELGEVMNAPEDEDT